MVLFPGVLTILTISHFSKNKIHVPGRAQPRCNGTECSHTEVKKIYLREVAVGTDNDFPFEDRSSVVEKSRRISFDNETGRHNGYRNRNNYDDCLAMPTNNTNRRNGAYSKAPPSKSKFSDAQTIKAAKSHAKERIGKNEDYHPRANAPQEESSNGQRAEPDEDEYTPVPVKQLIQEFEKTCRPNLQYKQISPKVIPIVQQSQIDNDLARFFEIRNPPKYNVEEEYRRVAESEEYEEPPRKSQEYCNNGYISTDDTEYTTEETDSQLDDEYGIEEEMMYRESSRRQTETTMNGDREYSSMFQEEYTTTRRRRSTTSDELENLCAIGEPKFVNTEQEVLPEAKSLLLQMVASQEDILATIKHLRNTPVLDNLLSVASPECTFTGVYPDVGKLYENNTYNGPKLATVHNLNNYNTAPRGWDQSLSFYRPVKFEKPQEIVYSDF